MLQLSKTQQLYTLYSGDHGFEYLPADLAELLPEDRLVTIFVRGL
jgi:hypothetical protein